MNKTAKRIIAGVSAAVMFVSAVGVGTFTNSFMKTSYADSGSIGKIGRSTGFSNLEQDTDGDDYNTGYGLHTNKTATEAADIKDGRTFDVNLESWYVGENPVDVATVLDASGSMAWTVDTLDPLEIDFKNENLNNAGYNSIEDLIKLQEANGGYLPQDVVDKILDPKNTDNSKLSYAGYKYYVYEARSSVSEFVPLGYWDGGKPTGMVEPIGYYPFEGSLTNEITNGTAKLISHAEDPGNIFDETKTPMVKVKPTFSGSGDDLQLDETAQRGALLADVTANGSFTISMRVKASEILDSSDGTKIKKMPLVYVGKDGNYISVYRSGDGSDPRRLKVAVNGKDELINIGNLFQKPNSSSIGTNGWVNISLSYNNSTSEIIIDLSEKASDSQKQFKGTFIGDFDGADIIIGGDVVSKGKDLPYSGVQLTDFCVFNKVLTTDEIAKLNTGTNIKKLDTLKEIGGLSAYYDFDKGSLTNRVKDSASLQFIEQAESGVFSKKPLEDVLAKPVYTDTTHQGKQALNLSETAKNGAVLLDAVPDKNNFSISFAVTNSNKEDTPKHEAELVYMGSLDKSKDYYNIFRSQNASTTKSGDPRHIRFSKNSDYTEKASGSKAFNQKNWTIATFTVKDGTVTAYVNGGKNEDSGGPTRTFDSLTEDDFAIILGGLVDEYDGEDILIDDLYVYDAALSEDQVRAAYTAASGSITSTAEDCGKYHATTTIGAKEVDIAQISGSLYNNPYDSQRRGWYYVNSHSEWKDIEGCLQGGKQYAGIKIEEDDGEKIYSHEDEATIPSSYTDDQKKAITSDSKHADYVPPTTERSIRFYVDDKKHLRCFVCAGGTSKENDPRTFCSVVYEKKDKQQTKYEALNEALNGFYRQLAEDSDLSNSAIVRFSTHNLMKEKAEAHLQSLILKNWTNYSTAYKEGTKERSDYMQNLLIPDEGETSLGVDKSAETSHEYPYVMTGGTYTWTGLKAFYDNMVDSKGATSGTVYNIANDARDKYLIIFTDGRDNNVDTSDKKYNGNGPNGEEVSQDSDLAKAWADKLKEEGYTIFCVMMAAGSISPTANETEYKKAYNFVTTLAGEQTDDPNARDYVSVIGAGAEEGGTSNVSEAFDRILKQIQQPRKDYTVQDYIDPRFDLVDRNDNVLKLGAGGVITNSEGKTLATVGNIIDDTAATGYLYTPRECENVNKVQKKDATGKLLYYVNEDRTETTTTPTIYPVYDVDNNGTGTIYYDDKKDMYYLRWTDQIIPMENESFDTDTSKSDTKYLDVWSATIRLKAKDDFIGGNNILTNGNEAGENLVYSDATIENMDKDDNYKLYGFKDSDKVDGKIPYRKKLEALSGTNRKINAVDADGVSQAVYGNGIDIPSSGFPRTTVNVKLLPLNAQNLNDVIYMGELVSPTMMLADLENGYMTGSYYLQYLERYAYRVYGEEADQMPLIELLNKWLKIDDKKEASKTFTIPYIYLPAPEYDEDGKLVEDTSSGKVKIQNSAGWDSDLRGKTDFADLNLRDITGFITYTWKRDDDSKEPQQLMEKASPEEEDKYDITKEYVVKNTKQIKYNLQLKFTPLKQENLPDDFNFDKIFITAKEGEGETGDKFFNIDENGIFKDTGVTAWDIKFNRTQYLQAMVSEIKTYQPHVMYNKNDEDADKTGKWVLVDDDDENFTSDKAVEAYTKDAQTIVDSENDKNVIDSGVYDWDSEYKKTAGEVQIEGNKLNEYTKTPNNVGFADKKGDTITDKTGNFIGSNSSENVYSLVANTTYVKDVVNGALALELVVDGKYLDGASRKINVGKTYTFDAIRYYDDPLDPLPYDSSAGKMNADTGEEITGKVAGKKYQLTFTVKDIPADTKPNEIYSVWAELTNVKVEDSDSPGSYIDIDRGATEANPYLGYTDKKSLPIGTYVISVKDTDMENAQYYIGVNGGRNVYFKYLKLDNASSSYTYNRFPDSVYDVSSDAAKDTSDNEYLINNAEVDYAPKNIADCSRTRDSAEKTQELTFYFGTVEKREVNGTNLTNTKGENRIENQDEDYAKDRLGIIMLSVDPNSLAISKKVTNTKGNEYDNQEWTFNIDFTLNDDEAEFKTNNDAGFKLTWYKLDAASGDWVVNTDPPTGYLESITFKPKAGGSSNEYTATIALKHGEKVVINGLPEGTWQVKEEENRALFYSPHNNAHGLGDGEWEYERADATSPNIQLNPASHVDFVNEFPYELPSAGGIGVDQFIFFGTVATVTVALTVIASYYKRRKRRRIN